MPPPSPGPASPATPSTVQEVYESHIAKARSEAEARPGDPDAAIAYADLVGTALAGGLRATDPSGRAVIDPLDALAKLDRAQQTRPDRTADIETSRGNLLRAIGRIEEAAAAYEAALDAGATVGALAPLVEIRGAQGRLDEVDARCRSVAERIPPADDGLRYAVLWSCARARPGAAPPAALPWASAEDVAFYAQQKARDDARRPQRQRITATGTAAPAPSPRPARPVTAASPTPPAAYHATVSVHSECRERVRLFRGQVNGRYSGSGTYGWHAPNAIASYTLTGDDELCIVQNDHDIVSCTKPSDGARLRITESCSGFSRR